MTENITSQLAMRASGRCPLKRNVVSGGSTVVNCSLKIKSFFHNITSCITISIELILNPTLFTCSLIFYTGLEPEPLDQGRCPAC